MIFVHPQADRDRTLVQVRAVIANDVPLTPALFEYVACKASEYTFGTLCVIRSEGAVGKVVMTHSLLGETCTSDALAAVVQAIASTADELDDTVVAIFGGRVSNPQ